MKKILLPLLIGICCAVPAKDIAYLYPVIFEKTPNLAARPLKDWHVSLMPVAVPFIKYGKVKGTPFDPEKESLYMRSDCTRYNYWRKRVKVTPNRQYLIGGWVKNEDAKMLCWFHGRPKGAKRIYDQRIFFSTGVKKMLKPYISAPVLEKLGGDTSWTLLYRIITIPPALESLTMAFGFYASTGRIVVGEAILHDITEAGIDERLQVHIDTEKPVKFLSVSESETRDLLWSRSFETPVKKFKEIIPRTSFRFLQDEKRKIGGYILKIIYADGSEKNFAAASNGSKSL